MDRITRSHLNSFRDEQSLKNMPEDTSFEYLANYCVVSGLYDNEFDVAALSVGGGNDLGIDGIGIIVNGNLVTSTDEVTDLLKLNQYLEVSFVFVQAKTSGNFDGAEMMSFADGVKEFFADQPTMPINVAISDARQVMNTIYDNSTKFSKRPSCRLYYVTTGRWQADSGLVGRMAGREASLQDTNLFEQVVFTAWGADELHAGYKRSQNNITAEFPFENKVTLPEIDGVDQAYLGTLPVKHFLSIITDTTGTIRKALFYDNVRDFQEYNEVNKDIQRTLEATSTRQRFAVLNNGVTIVARNLKTVGNRFSMTDFQIVNGCQTSHVLFDERDKLSVSGEVHIPLKIIVTDNEDLTSSIIRATNRQTEVSSEDLYALSTFQKKLEDFYAAQPDGRRLYYERRSRQYSSMPNIEKVRIINKQQQIRAFAAMFLDNPHQASRYLSELKAMVPTRIFNDSHKLDPYYVSAYAYYKLEFFFRNGLISPNYKPTRYQLLMIVRYLCGGADMPALTANKMEVYSSTIAKQLGDDDSALQLFKRALTVVDAAAGGADITRDSVKTQSFTDSVKKALVAV